jgi:phenylpyruvate tautomerase PptA (4-oxalocrotonate tautomerase family)
VYRLAIGCVAMAGFRREGASDSMPYLQLDVPNHYPLEVKRDLARRLGAIYARIMQTTPDLVTVAFRELGEGGVWCCGGGEPEPAALLSCDIRRGRAPEQRAELAQALIDVCVETLGLRSDRLAVEFTQHASDEMYRHGRGWGTEWMAAEATGSAEGLKDVP